MEPQILVRACTDAIRANIERLTESAVRGYADLDKLIAAYTDTLYYVLLRLATFPEDAARALHQCAAI